MQIPTVRGAIHASCVSFLLMLTMAGPVSAWASPSTMVRPRTAMNRVTRTVKGVTLTPPLPEPLMRLHAPENRQRNTGGSRAHRHTHASRGNS
ncbi:hypothetical protein [Acidithiobacillus ferrooxidans]|uniref:hypothetical protein n=1 Tax=Acidithiobacillus ferrooxidans TaxID=920 RepID=UPI0013D18D7F|nr:hypothetical protein [Acidithiobacillus ferrooxidans]